MRIAICDDEAIMVEKLYTMLVNVSRENEHKVVTFTNADTLSFAIEEGMSFDLLIMDILFSNKKENGIDYAARICSQLPNLQVIFMTSFSDKFSQEIFLQNVNLCGYLKKPIQESILISLLNKANTELSMKAEDSFVIENKKGVTKIPYSRISYLESEGHKLIVYSHLGKYAVYMKLNEVIKLFPNNFVQCHKSYLINMDEIVRIEGKTVCLRDGSRLEMSRSKYKSTIERFLEYSKRV